jgi:hypothetical protein
MTSPGASGSGEGPHTREFDFREGRVAIARLLEYCEEMHALIPHLEHEKARLLSANAALVERYEAELTRIREGESIWLPHALDCLTTIRSHLPGIAPRERSDYARALKALDSLLQRFRPSEDPP